MTNGIYWLFWLKFLVPFCFAIVACTTDVKDRRIPNLLSVTLLISGLGFGAVTGGWNGLAMSLGGFAAGFGTLFVLFAIGGGGAGDVKFMGAVGSWIGAYHILFVFVLSALLLAAFSTIVFFYRQLAPSQKGIPMNASIETEVGEKVSPFRIRLPYAVPAAAAILVRFAWLLLIGRNS